MIIVILTTYPIDDPLRTTLIILEWIFSLICFELGIVFFNRYRKPEKELRNYQELGYAGLLVGIGMMWFFFIAADYYSSNIIESGFFIWEKGCERALFKNFGYGIMIINSLFCIFMMEKYKIFLFKKYFFTILFVIFLSIYAIIFFIDLFLTEYIFFYMFYPLFFSFLIIYIIDFSKRAQKKENLIGGVLKFLSGFILIGVGLLFTSDLIIGFYSIEIRLIGSFLQVISIFLIYFFFINLPPFSEFDWYEKIEHLFIIDKGGICLYNHVFGENSDLMDENLISGAISSINLILQELTDIKGISVLRKKGKVVIIVPSELSTGVIFCTEELSTIKLLLKRFVEKFETIFHNILFEWDGDLQRFKNTEKIINEIFLE